MATLCIAVVIYSKPFWVRQYYILALILRRISSCQLVTSVFYRVSNKSSRIG